MTLYVNCNIDKNKIDENNKFRYKFLFNKPNITAKITDKKNFKKKKIKKIF